MRTPEDAGADEPGERRGADGLSCDVLIIGGGIVGLSTAYAITRAAPGTRVTVLEKEAGPPATRPAATAA
ncbi:FAD-dependent oxidoreductase [Streptomyces sp. M19]